MTPNDLRACLLQVTTLLAICGAAGLAAAREFHVSTAGDDAHDGSEARPFATIPRAMAAVRQGRAGHTVAGPVNVYLHGGVYPLAEKLTFGPEDSGTAESPVTIQSNPGQRAVLSGGRRLTGTWRQSPGKPYYELDLPEVRTDGWRFFSLYVNDHSRMRARAPNWGSRVCRAQGRTPGEDPRQAFTFAEGDIDPAWSNPTDIDVVLLCSWTPTLHRIQEIDAARRVVRFHSSHGRAVDFWEKNFRFYLSNVFEALDEPGEWYLNRHAGTLYYYPLPGEDPNTTTFVAPVLKSQIMEIAGDVAAGKFVQHLHFRDLEIRHLDGDMDRYNGMYRQGHMYLTAAVAARGLRSASFVDCTLAQLGEYAMELGDGCRDVLVQRCHIWDIGAGALQLGVTDLATLLAPGTENREVLDLAIDNNCIHRLGTIWHGCYGIVNRFASRTRMTHNEIYDTHWDAIGLDARWNWRGEKYSHGNVVAYNHLHHLGLRYHTDAAGVYQFGPLDTHIHHNLIHDTRAYPYICGYAGIYLDEQSRGALVENNLVFNVEWNAYFQHKGTDNVFRNNIGGFARDGLIHRGSLNETWKANYLEAYRNLYVTDNEIALRRGWEPGKKPPVLRANMYHTLAPNTELTFAGESLAQWQASDQDQGSVIGDPGFRDPARGDFSLPPDAPAIAAVGFVRFDDEIRTAGLYGDPSWRNVSEKYPPRQPTAVWSPEELARFVAFDLDFEDMPVGYQPDVFRLGTSGEATFAVSDEAAYTGTKCYKCVDKKGLLKTFYPYIHLAPKGLNQGPVTFSFAAMLDAAAAAPFHVEFRGVGSTQQAGPSLRFHRDGRIEANGRQVLTAPPGTWTHCQIAFRLGEGASKSYTLTLQHEGTTSRHELPFRHDTFAEVSWLGFTASDDADGAFYLDDMKLCLD